MKWYALIFTFGQFNSLSPSSALQRLRSDSTCLDETETRIVIMKLRDKSSENDVVFLHIFVTKFSKF
jgi:hypothetical protein